MEWKCPPVAKYLLIPPPKVHHSHLIRIFMGSPNRNFIYSCSHYCFIISFLTSCSFYTHHANFDFNWCSIFRKCCFSMVRGSNGQNHSSSDLQHPMKKIPTAKFASLHKVQEKSPYLLLLFGKPWTMKNYIVYYWIWIQKVDFYVKTILTSI